VIKFSLGCLLALSVSSLAMTLCADDSLTLNKEEIENVENYLHRMETEREYALRIIMQLQKKIESFEKSRCI
jgi:hypothetical protein